MLLPLELMTMAGLLGTLLWLPMWFLLSGTAPSPLRVDGRIEVAARRRAV